MLGKKYCSACSQWINEEFMRKYRDVSKNKYGSGHWRCHTCQAKRVAHQRSINANANAHANASPK